MSMSQLCLLYHLELNIVFFLLVVVKTGAEMFLYVGTLRVLTEGRASYSMQFDRFDTVSRNIQNELTTNY